MEHRRLMMLFAAIALFAFGVIVWYFLFSTPKAAPTLETTTNPLSVRDLPARFGFIFNQDPPEQASETEVTPPGSQPFARIWDKPATGNVFVERPILREVAATTTVGTSTVATTRTVRATTTVLMFVDRITGYVYGYAPESGTTYQVSNTTIPGVYDAYIWGNGERILMRYLDTDRKTIRSILAEVPNIQEGRDPQPLVNVTNLPQDISSIAVSASLGSLSYLVENDLGSSVYTISSKGTSKVADSPFSEWSLSYGGEVLYATTKPSAYIEGMTVILPSFSRVISEKTGLLSAPAPGGTLLSSMWAKTGLVTFGVQNGNLLTASVRTIASKCTPSDATHFLCGVPKSIPQGEEGLPDDWYQGRVSFDDTLMIINVTNGEAYTVYEPDPKFTPLDMVSIKTTKGNGLISFINKQDGSLFMLNTALLGDSYDE